MKKNLEDLSKGKRFKEEWVIYKVADDEKSLWFAVCLKAKTAPLMMISDLEMINYLTVGFIISNEFMWRENDWNENDKQFL